MPTLLSQAAHVQAAGNKPKFIDEYIGRVNSKNEAVREPEQTPEFDEFTIVLKGVHRGLLDENRASGRRMKHH